MAACPPKIFTPSLLLCESRPFFTLPSPFLCAIRTNLKIPIHLCDIRYFNLCIVCTMSVFLTKSFSSVHFKRDHFIALDMTEDFNFYHALYVLACSEFTIRAG